MDPSTKSTPEWRPRALFYACVLALMGILTWMFADLLWRVDLSFLKFLLVLLFSLLSFPIATGFFATVFGLAFTGNKSSKGPAETEAEDIGNRNVAVNIPVYNEDIERVLARLRAMYHSLRETGQLDGFDFYLLSDSNDPDKWVAEEYGWARLCRELDAFDRIFYRRRKRNVHQKAGNLLNFCESWGRRYKYMIILDADSLMEGGTLVRMARRMENNPRMGILQTIPLLTRAETRYGMLQQFVNRLYGPLFARGMAFWQGAKGNYWGHNAIIRVEPFIRHCALPDLPGKPPLGGKILSHDFVEAALMVRAGYEVRMDVEAAGSFEEGPSDLLDSAMRDRRWCQGNLQHFWLLFADKIHWASKLHFINGIFAYAGALLWLLFLVLSIALAFEWEKSRLSLIPVSGTSPLGGLSIGQHALLLFSTVLVLLIAPKLLVIAGASFSRARRREFGGSRVIILLGLFEMAFSTLMAPVLMVYHSRFVLLTLSGKGIGWAAQQRSANGLPWRSAWRSLWMHTIAGLLILLVATQVGLLAVAWLAPIWGGLLFCVPLTVWSSRKATDSTAGKFLAASSQSAIEQKLAAGLREFPAGIEFFTTSASGLQNVIVDPVINAVHLSLLDVMDGEADTEMPPAAAFLKEDPESLSRERVIEVLQSPSSLRELHHLIWRLPESELHPQWRNTLERYSLKPVFAS